MKSVLTKISAIKRNPNNPRILKDDKFVKLTQSIKDFPQMLEIRPIVVNDDMVVLGGNMRLKACKEAGLKEVPVIKVNDLTEEQQREFIIKDNVGFGEWDWDLLANEWDTDLLEDWGLELDFNPVDDDNDGLTDEDDVPEVTEEPVSKVGDIWLLGEHRVMCGDSTSTKDIGSLMNGEKADMVFTDPPYNIGFQGTMGDTTIDGKKVGMKDGYIPPNSIYEDIKNDKKTKEEFKLFIDSALDRIKENVTGGWYICFASTTIDELLIPLVEKDMKWKSLIVWNKNQSPMGGGHFRKKYEPIAYGYFNNNFYGIEYSEDDVWDIDRTKKNDLHPTMKPIPLIEKAIGYSSKKNGKVLDLFLGSGSTLIAAEKKNRKCYGMELDPKYIDVIIKRWQDYTGKKAIHAESGDEFVEVDNGKI